MKNSQTYASLVMLCGAFATHAVYADEQQPTGAQPPATEQPPTTEFPKMTVQETVESVYVAPNTSTGTKTDTPVMETPLNVQTVTQQVLVDQQVITLSQALQNVSGVSVLDGVSTNDGYGSAGILVRGFTEQTYYRDGFRVDTSNLGTDVISTRQLANVDSIEVMKGPGAILYGLVEPGGIINIVTKDPLSTPYYSVQQQIGSLKDYRTSLDATGLLTDGDVLQYRLNMSYESNGAPFGSIVDLVSSDNTFLAPVLQWNVNGATWIKLEGEYARVRTDSYSPFDPLDGTTFITVPRSVNYGQNSPLTQTTKFAALTWSHQFNQDWSIKQQVAYDRIDESESTTGPFTITTPPPQIQDFSLFLSGPQTTYSTNVDLIGHFNVLGTAHTLLIGGDVYHSYGDIGYVIPDSPNTEVDFPVPSHNFTYPPCPCYTSAYGFSQDTSGLYLQDQIKLPLNLFLLAGGRYQSIRQTSTSGNTTAELSPQAAPLSGHATTPRVGLLWRPAQWLSLYSIYTQGYGPNSGAIYPGTLAPPTSANSKEAGVKLELLDGRLRITADYFNLLKTNVTTPDPNPAHSCYGGGAGSCSILIGAVRSKGPELDIQGEVLPGWNVIAAYSNDDIHVAEGNPYYYVNLAVGQQLPLVPRSQASFWNTYEFKTGALNGLKIGGGVHYTGSQLIEDEGGNPPGTFPPLPSYTTVDLMAAYSFTYARPRITAQLNLTNLLNKTYYESAANFYPVGTGIVSGEGSLREYGAPFAAMGSIRVEF